MRTPSGRGKTSIRVGCLLCLISASLAFGPLARAQDTGQICVQSFDDRDESGLRDANEPTISRGIGVHLFDALNITIASKLLGESPYAATGLVCFDGLPAGDYLLTMTSSEFVATTPSSYNAAVNPGSAPERVDFGVKSLYIERSSSEFFSGIALDTDTALGLLLGVIAGVIVFLIMFLLGLLIYLRVFRRRARHAPRQQTPPTAVPNPATGMGATAAVASETPPLEQTANPRFMRDPSQGSPRLFSDEDTDASPAN